MQVDIEDLEIARFQAASILAMERFEHYAAAGLVDPSVLETIRSLEIEAKANPTPCGLICDDDVHAMQVEAMEKLEAGGKLAAEDKLRWRKAVHEFFET